MRIITNLWKETQSRFKTAAVKLRHQLKTHIFPDPEQPTAQDLEEPQTFAKVKFSQLSYANDHANVLVPRSKIHTLEILRLPWLSGTVCRSSRYSERGL